MLTHTWVFVWFLLHIKTSLKCNRDCYQYKTPTIKFAALRLVDFAAKKAEQILITGQNVPILQKKQVEEPKIVATVITIVIVIVMITVIIIATITKKHQLKTLMNYHHRHLMQTRFLKLQQMKKKTKRSLKRQVTSNVIHHP